MSPPVFEITAELPERHRLTVATIYCEAFAAKLAPFLGETNAAAELLAPNLRAERGLIAFDRQADEVLGVAGFKHGGQAFTDVTWSAMQQAFGRLGAAWRSVGLLIFDRDEAEGELLMDGIAVAESARGRGVGTALLEAVLDVAAERGLHTVRLDVVDTNPRARKLYERMGFVATQTQRLPLLGKTFGFSSSTTMIRTL